MRKILTVFSLLLVPLAILLFQNYKKLQGETEDVPLKLYWFIPDGLRAEAVTFKVYEWARSGELPNFKYLMENGSYGYSIPQFPSHTPVNFASLLTGATPKTHGISDGPIRLEGYPLKMAAIGGFKSTSKLVDPISFDLEQKGESVALLSVPGTTPPELDFGLTVKGRWGGWGFDFTSVIWQTETPVISNLNRDEASRVFYTGPRLTEKVDFVPAKGWSKEIVAKYNPQFESRISPWGFNHFIFYSNSTKGLAEGPIIGISKGKKSVIASVVLGKWSDWLPVELYYQSKNPYDINKPKRMEWEEVVSEVKIPTNFKVRFVLGDSSKDVRVRYIFDGLNESLVSPSNEYEAIKESTGPFVDFVDNFPPQLIHFEEDKAVFLEESAMSIESHRRLLAKVLSDRRHSVVLQNIYTPNQMLTSRWWMAYLDPQSDRYNDIDEEKRQQLWREVKEMYKGIDLILGEALNKMDSNSTIVLSSDHGILPLNYEVRVNNILAQKGWLKYSWNPKKGTTEIDWAKTKVVFLNMYHLFVNPNGLSGPYKPNRSKETEDLVAQVKQELTRLRGPNGRKIFDKVLTRKEANVFNLPEGRIGDLVIAANPGFHWVEDIHRNGQVFHQPKNSGYKQAVDPHKAEGLQTPFLILSPKVKKGFQIASPIRHIDQLATIYKALGYLVPEHCEGNSIDAIFK